MHQEKVKGIEQRVSELLSIKNEKENLLKQQKPDLLARKIKTLTDQLSDQIENGSIDEGIALAISNNEKSYLIFHTERDKKIDYDIIFKNHIDELTILYQPTYWIYTGYSSDFLGNYYQIYCDLKPATCIIF